MDSKAMLGLTCIVAGLWTVTAGAVTPEEKCEANKLKTAGKYAFCRLKADAKAVKTGTAPDYSKCDEKFGNKWGAVESKADGACPVTGDGEAIQTLATSCTADLMTAIGRNRFVDNGDGTITDTTTGLVWEKKTELDTVANFSNPHDADNLYFWHGFSCVMNAAKYCQPTTAAAALCAAHAEGSPNTCHDCILELDGPCLSEPTVWGAVADLNAASFAGYTDWRVPTRQELQTIVDYADATAPAVDVAFHGSSCGAACTDITDPVCSCTPTELPSPSGGARANWSASTYASPAGLFTFWSVSFVDGLVSPEQNDGLFFRAVRGGKPSARFVDNGDGTITDNATGLMWEKKTGLDAVANLANLHDADNLYAWSGACTVLASKRCQPTAAAAALCAAHVDGNPEGCAECSGGEGTCSLSSTIWTAIAELNAAGFAGHTDWRVPTHLELQTIFDYGAPPAFPAFRNPGCGPACTDITDPTCSCTPSSGCWSASTYTPSQEQAWSVSFFDGLVNPSDSGNALSFRAVRGL